MRWVWAWLWGHEVTIFTRGKSKTKIAGIEHLIGDRAGDLKALKGRQWDVVLDNNARDYRWVKLTTELLHSPGEQPSSDQVSLWAPATRPTVLPTGLCG